MPARRTNPDYLNGVPELLILQLLSPGRCTATSWCSRSAWSRRSDSSLAKAASIRCCIAWKWRVRSTSQRENVGGRSRVVYRVSPAGQERLDRNTSRWCHVVEAVQWVLQGGAHGHVGLA